MRLPLVPALVLAVALPFAACSHRAESPPPQETRTEVATAPIEAPPPPAPAIDAGAPAPAAEKKGQNEACASDDECEHGMVCEGCTDEDRRCITGCRTDADCAPERCVRVQCIRCPCPPKCGK